MRLIPIIIALLAICIPAVGTEQLPDDAALSRTITLNLKGEALSDVTKILSKAADINIRTTKDVADQKVTLIVDSMPLKDIMNHLATLFGWKWAVKNDDDGISTYVIYDPLKQQREADRKEALDKAWKALGEKLNSLSPSDNKASNFYETLALQQYKSFSPEMCNAYLSGMHICFNPESPNIAWRPSQSVMDEFSDAESKIQKQIVKVPEGWAAWNPDLKNPSAVSIDLYSVVGTNLIIARSKIHISYLHPDSSDSGAFGIGMGISSISDDDESAGVSSSEGGFDLCTQTIDYPSETIESSLPNNPTDELLSKKISLSTAELISDGAFEEENASCSVTRTDLLAALHKKLGVQIISDYYSSWAPISDIGDITVQQLLEKKMPGFPAYWGWDGSVLYMRVKDIRTADSKEIPNRFLRPWQTVVKKQGYRGLDELAQAAAYLNGEQTQALLKNCRYLKLGDCKEVDDTAGWENSLLRFYGTLTPKQKKDIFTGQVGVMDLNLEQKNALSALIYTANFSRSGIYNTDGINMNEPQVVRGSSGSPAVSLHMTCSGSFIYSQPGDDFESRLMRSITATTPEEALLTAKNWLLKDGDPQYVVAQDDIVYTLTVNYEGFTFDEPSPQFSGSIGRSRNSTYHRVKIQIPEKMNHTSR